MSLWSRALVFAAGACILAGTAASASDIPLKAPARAPSYFTPAPWINVFGGFAVAPDSYFGDVGVVFAVNRNLRTDGWLVRFHGGAGHYSYNRTATLEQGVSFQKGEAMIGYQKFFGGTRVSVYVGPNVEHHNNPDPLATVKGTKWGIKAQGEIFAPLNDSFYLFALANISSAWSSYFVLGKLGYRVTDSIAIGPEVAALGNDRYDAVRLGPFLAFDITPSAQVILSGGYSWDTNSTVLNNHSGAYGTIHVRGEY